MPIELLSSFFALILAISLASERLVTLLKTLSQWLREAQTDATAEKVRRVVVYALAFVSAWLTTGFLTEGAQGYNLLGSVAVAEDRVLPAWVVAFLASGGSSLWNNLLGYTKAVKEIARERLPAHTQKAPN